MALHTWTVQDMPATWQSVDGQAGPLGRAGSKEGPEKRGSSVTDTQIDVWTSEQDITPEQDFTQDITPEQDFKIAIDTPDGIIYVSINLETIRDMIDVWLNNASAALADPANATPKNQMMRLSLNSALLGIGPMITRLLWQGEGEPPRPGRKDDLMEWYIRFAAEQIVSGMEKSTSTSMLHLEATDITSDENTATIRVDAIHSRPVAS